MKAVTITGTAVKRLKKEVPLLSSGTILIDLVSPRASADIAITEQIPTNKTARSTDTNELSHNDSANHKKPRQ